VRLGILGGSFDPVHLGHLLVADDVREKLGLDRVLFVPTFCAGHRVAPVASYRHRCNMTRLATESWSGLEPFPVEDSLPVPSYTVNTLGAVRARFPGASLYFLVGSDQYCVMAAWHKPLELVRLARLVVMSRPGVAAPALLPGHRPGRVVMLDVIAVAISAALVRGRLAKGRSVRYMLPEAVLEYISRHRLYISTALWSVGRLSSPDARQPRRE
jgi:nicotinate-nucleotide adenylyltransferase